MCQGKDYYLDLMKKCLTNWIYCDYEMREVSSNNFWKKKIVDLFEAKKMKIMRLVSVNRKNRSLGVDFPPYAHTMIGLKRLDNIQFLAEETIKNKIPGDFMEAGVWRGGAVIFMRAILKAYDIQDRDVWCADSFEGLPPPNLLEYIQDADSEMHTIKYFSASIDEVKANFELYGLLDSQVHFLKGWFKDSLPAAPIDKLAILRLDADMYESTMDALVNDRFKQLMQRLNLL